jgi:hypothetical protein
MNQYEFLQLLAMRGKTDLLHNELSRLEMQNMLYKNVVPTYFKKCKNNELKGYWSANVNNKVATIVCNGHSIVLIEDNRMLKNLINDYNLVQNEELKKSVEKYLNNDLLDYNNEMEINPFDVRNGCIKDNDVSLLKLKHESLEIYINNDTLKTISRLRRNLIFTLKYSNNSKLPIYIYEGKNFVGMIMSYILR